MNWTFGYITAGGQDSRILKIIESIEEQGIDDNKYEIIIVGSCNIKRKNLTVIPFDENVKKGWITKKKNIIAKEAKFENLVLSHDYVKLMPDFYSGYKKFGEEWDVSVPRITRMDGVRYLDWFRWNPKMQLIPYDDTTHTNDQTMFAPGFFFCTKKSFIMKYPLNENLVWGDGEDCDWSFRLNSFWNYRCNVFSEVRFIKVNRLDVPENGKLNTKEDGEFIFGIPK